MARILVFLGTIAAALAGVAALNWWMDPLADQYHERFLDQALAHQPPCMISWGVLKSRSWASFKLDLARRTPMRIAVVGTSRVGKMQAWPGERDFANVGSPGLGAESLPDLFSRLHDAHPGELTMYVGADLFWFGSGWQTFTWFDTSYLRDLKYLLAASTTEATVRLLRYAPGGIRHPQRLLYTDIDREGKLCMVDRGNTVFGGGSPAWGADGTLWFASELKGRRLADALLIDRLPGAVTGSRLAPRAVAALDQALARADSYGWKVVGFAPPFSPGVIRRLTSRPQTRGLYFDYRRRLPGIFARHGFRFLDLTDVASIPCSPRDFSLHDGGHADVPCSRRIRRKLDAAAGISRPIPPPAR